MRRYTRDRQIRGKKLESANTVLALRRSRDLGLIQTRELILKEAQRLDHIAYEQLGNSMHWWIIAAFSDIGWGMQVPAGTILRIPTDMNAVRVITGG